MPFAQRATALAVVFGVAATVVVGGCSSDRQATGFCAEIEHGHAAFDSVGKEESKRALAELDRVVASAPAAIAPDLKTVSTALSLFYNDPKAFSDPAGFKRYTAAIDRVDEYLRDTCGIRIPRRKGT